MTNLEKLPPIADAESKDLITVNGEQEINSKPFVLPEFTEHAVDRDKKVAELLSKIRPKIS